MNPIPTKHGFNFGSAEVVALVSDEKKGWVVIGVNTPKSKLQVHVTKTGHVRVFKLEGDEWMELR